MKRIAIVLPVILAACSPSQLSTAQTDVAKVQTTVSNLCGTVNAAAALAAPFSAIPQVGAILLYSTAACSTANAVAGMVQKTLDDPNTIAWLQKLATDIKAITPR